MAVKTTQRKFGKYTVKTDRLKLRISKGLNLYLWVVLTYQISYNQYKIGHYYRLEMFLTNFNR